MKGDLFKRVTDYNKPEAHDRLRRLENAELELAHLDFDISRSIKRRANQEIVVQQLCELATGHDFENGNDGDETDTCARCGFERTPYSEYLEDMADDVAKEITRRGL